MDFSIVPKRIEEILEKAPYGSEVYSVEMGYETDYLNRIVFGYESPTLELLEKFCKYFNVDFFYLLGLIDYVDVEF